MDMPAVDDIDFFDNLQGTCFNAREEICDTLSLKLNSELSEIRSLSEYGSGEHSDQKEINFEDKGKILENSPEIFKDSARDLNAKLNSKLKYQFDEIHGLLDKMAEIILKTDPKKSAFIMDCRHQPGIVTKSIRKISKKKKDGKSVKPISRNKSAGLTKNAYILESDNSLPDLVNDPYENSTSNKRGSFYTASTAASKKLKVY